MKKGLWIPNEILHLEDLNITEKHVLAVIFSFASGSKGMCTARNSTIAEAGRVATTTVEHNVSKLISKGYLIKKGRVQNRVLTVNLMNSTSVQHTEATSVQHTEDSCTSYRSVPPNIQKTSVQHTEAFIKIKERDKERYKEGVYIAPAENKNEEGNLINDERTNEEDHEQFLHDFWCKELGL